MAIISSSTESPATAAGVSLGTVVTFRFPPLLLVPAKLREKTIREFAALAEDWPGGPKDLRIYAYEQMGRVGYATVLEEMAPDVIIADECHRLKNKKAAVTRRVSRYMKAHPDTAFVAMSGTVTKRSLQDFGHLLEWCRGRWSPLPAKSNELMQWALAVDEKLRFVFPFGARADRKSFGNDVLPL